MTLSPRIDNERTANIVGIDPGTTNLGLSVLSFDVLSFEIVRTEAITLCASKLPTYSKQLSLSHGDKFARIRALCDSFYNVILHYDPLSIVSESPFYNPRRPNAYGSLVEIVTNLQATLFKFNTDKPIYFIDPSSIKNAVGASGGAGKDPVRAGVVKLQDKISLSIELTTELDEHSIDSIAAAYAFYKRKINKDI